MSDPIPWPPCLDEARRRVLAAYDIVQPEQLRGLMGGEASRAGLVALVGFSESETAALHDWLVARGLDPADVTPGGRVQHDFPDAWGPTKKEEQR